MPHNDNDDKGAQRLDVPPNPFADAPIVSAYTRADALADGVLVDVSEMAREAGIVHPTAITHALFELLQPTDEARGEGQSFAGRLWDVLSLGRIAMKRTTGDTARWSLWIALGKGRRKRQDVWARCTGEGHNGAPVITIMLDGED